MARDASGVNAPKWGVFILNLTAPKSQNYGCTVEATHAKKARCRKGSMDKFVFERASFEALGLGKDKIDDIFDSHSKKVGDAKQAAETERDELKKQLEEVQAKLKAFEGVDVTQLNGEIEKLKDDLKTKDADYQAKIADRDFSDTLTAALHLAKVKSAKAASALLDVETLKASKNQKADIDAAIAALKESDAYIFDVGGEEGALHGAKPGESADPSSGEAITPLGKTQAKLNSHRLIK